MLALCANTLALQMSPALIYMTPPPKIRVGMQSHTDRIGGHESHLGGRMLAPTFRPSNTLGGGMPSRPSP